MDKGGITMDRDLASQLVTTMGSIKTALETIATNSTPADNSAKSSPDQEETRSEPEPEEPVQEEPKTTRSTKK